MYAEPRKKTSVSLISPVLSAIADNTYWYIAYDSEKISKYELKEYVHSIRFNPDKMKHRFLLETGQLFLLQEHAEYFLNNLQKARN